MKIKAYLITNKEVKELFLIFVKKIACHNKRTYVTGVRTSYKLNGSFVDSFVTCSDTRELFHIIHVEHGNFIYFSVSELNERQKIQLQSIIEKIMSTGA